MSGQILKKVEVGTKCPIYNSNASLIHASFLQRLVCLKAKITTHHCQLRVLTRDHLCRSTKKIEIVVCSATAMLHNNRSLVLLEDFYY